MSGNYEETPSSNSESFRINLPRIGKWELGLSCFGHFPAVTGGKY